MTLLTMDGGDGRLPDPDWSLIFSDELDIEAAQEHWRAVNIELRDTDKLAACNAHQIKRLVTQYVLYDRALRRVVEQEAVVKAKRSKVAQHNPWWTVLQQANSAASALEAELTISPRRRDHGGKVQRKVRKTTAADAYLRPVAK